MTTGRYTSAPVIPARRNSRQAKPPTSAPIAAVREPTRLYQAKTAIRLSSGTVCESAACSIERNGPTSLSAGLSTPIVATTTSRTKLPVVASTPPTSAINRAPRINIRLRPMRSAAVVIHREMTVSPSSVMVSKRPICPAVSPRAFRYSTSTTEREPQANMRTLRVANRSSPSPVRGRETRGNGGSKGKKDSSGQLKASSVSPQRAVPAIHARDDKDSGFDDDWIVEFRRENHATIGLIWAGTTLETRRQIG